VIIAVFVTLPAEAVIFTVWVALNAVVVTLNVAFVAPVGMNTLPGTVANAWLDARLTMNPPVGAFLEMVTVPPADEPPLMEVGLIEIDESD